MSGLNLSIIHLLLLFSLSGVVSYFGHIQMKCQFNSKDLRDTELVLNLNINKGLVAEYNSSTNRFTANTEWVKKLVDSVNDEPDSRHKIQFYFDQYCRRNIPLMYEYIMNKTLKPQVRLSLAEPSGTRHSAMLVCSAYRFYPKDIIVTWLKNGQKVTSDVSSTEQLADSDWSYQIHSYLEYTPTAGEIITCMVEHYSLTEPQLHDWDSSIPWSERNNIVIGASVLLLGAVSVAMGLIYYRKKSTANRTGPI
ncbi:H-2 class II histocompatibility antigen, E-S beta chain-like [Esox lucius]|uniref:Ig-like domain-containing protein n=1 Tax=Esox lucius TaxID=8010 RepID=A0AAY5KWN3_ESOLU|nr:H-2 class II histocompatibility antigen, E-S beta chain-like [Esox lucius]